MWNTTKGDFGRMATLHLQKLSVGTETVEDLAAWQATKRAQTPDGVPRHVTRMWPKREADLLEGGSIFWVIKGVILCRDLVNRPAGQTVTAAGFPGGG